ncbi:hypothetical protein HDU76_004173 [Blyttiomyces sp. JEL0837]|nr:hypothetical protein HDU76_004173 [Blyttiomyces sp. JEL0837]
MLKQQQQQSPQRRNRHRNNRRQQHSQANSNNKNDHPNEDDESMWVDEEDQDDENEDLEVVDFADMAGPRFDLQQQQQQHQYEQTSRGRGGRGWGGEERGRGGRGRGRGRGAFDDSRGRYQPPHQPASSSSASFSTPSTFEPDFESSRSIKPSNNKPPIQVNQQSNVNPSPKPVKGQGARAAAGKVTGVVVQGGTSSIVAVASTPSIVVASSTPSSSSSGKPQSAKHAFIESISSKPAPAPAPSPQNLNRGSGPKDFENRGSRGGRWATPKGGRGGKPSQSAGDDLGVAEVTDEWGPSEANRMPLVVDNRGSRGEGAPSSSKKKGKEPAPAAQDVTDEWGGSEDARAGTPSTPSKKKGKANAQPQTQQPPPPSASQPRTPSTQSVGGKANAASSAPPSSTPSSSSRKPSAGKNQSPGGSVASQIAVGESVGKGSKNANQNKGAARESVSQNTPISDKAAVTGAAGGGSERASTPNGRGRGRGGNNTGGRKNVDEVMKESGPSRPNQTPLVVDNRGSKTGASTLKKAGKGPAGAAVEEATDEWGPTEEETPSTPSKKKKKGKGNAQAQQPPLAQTPSSQSIAGKENEVSSAPSSSRKPKGGNQESSGSSASPQISVEGEAMGKTPKKRNKNRGDRDSGSKDSPQVDQNGAEGGPARDVGTPQKDSKSGGRGDRSAGRSRFGNGPNNMDSPRMNRESTPSKGQSRKPAFFEEYLSIEAVEECLANKTLVQGVLRINKRSQQDSYVTPEAATEDIYIAGKKLRNRAMEGDVVVVKILEKEELENELERDAKRQIQRKLEDEQRQLNCTFEDKDEEKVEEEKVLLDENSKGFKVFGKVVFIMDRRENLMFSGTLTVENPLSQSTVLSRDGPVDASVRSIWFRPSDKRVPFFVVNVEDAPEEFLKNPKLGTELLWKASIRKWPIQAQYPYGIVHGKVGLIGNIAVETQALLLDCGIIWDEFGEEVIDCLPKTPWTIPEEEFKRRRDFRSERVVSIDPLTARDLDDALSVVRLEDGNYAVSVHIADVSHFVTQGSALDKEAQYRATTVYLVQKAIPMLPRLLCEELCSLNPGVDRLAFSVTWTMDSEANVIGKPWFGKSVIHSCAKLSYDHAQALIDGKDWTDLPTVTITDGHTIEDIRNDVMLFYELSKKMRGRRFENGALAINSIKLWFSLDENGNPTGTGPYELKESNRLIEEFMLLANMAVAARIAEAFPESALLRRHDRPKERPLQELIAFAEEIGYRIDASSSSSLQQSFDAIDKEEVRDALRQLSIKSMQRAKYFCTGSIDLANWGHYALNVPLYTHFTSPIRRYCDLVVHRMLQVALEAEEQGVEPVSLYAKEDVGAFAKNCNGRKSSSKDAQDTSQKIYLCNYLSGVGKMQMLARGDGLPGVVAKALVYRVGARSFDVLVDEFGIEQRVWIEDLVTSNEIYGYVDNEENVSPQPAKGADSANWRRDEVMSTPRQAHQQRFDSPGNSGRRGGRFGNRNGNGNGNGNGDRNGDAKARKRLRLAQLNPSQYMIQIVKIFDHHPVRIVADVNRSPPDLKVYPMYPDTPVFSSSQYDLSANVSCPGLVEEAD